MTAPETVVPEPPAPALSLTPIAEEALAAMPEGRRGLYAPLATHPLNLAGMPEGDDWPTIGERIAASWEACRPVLAPVRFDHASRAFMTPDLGVPGSLGERAQERLLSGWLADAHDRTFDSPWWRERAARISRAGWAPAPSPEQAAAMERAERALQAEDDRLAAMAREQAGIWQRPEEVMPTDPDRNAQGRERQLENVPRPGRELAPEDGTGPESHGTDPAVAVASTGPGHPKDAPMRSGTIPPPVAEPEPAPAPEPQADSDAEQFGAPDEPFWGDDAPRIVPPPETAEMTAITEKPGEQQ